MNRLKFYILAGTVAVALAGAYVIWGPVQKTKRKQRVPGLKNWGNCCFLNAVVQALAACPSFISWLQKVVDRSADKRDCCLCDALLSLLKELNSDCKICDVTDVIYALQKHQWVITNDEQDAHEFLHVLMTTLEEEIVDPKQVLSLLEVSKLEPVKNETGHGMCKPFLSHSADTSGNTLPYRGLLSHQLICKQCGYKYPVKYDSFDSISLSLPLPSWGSLHLHDCLAKFISCEQIPGVTCDSCCKKELSTSFTPRSTFIKQMSFGKLPECLCFHIQRTMWMSNGVPTKCFDYVQFPEILYMDSFVHKCNPLNGSQVFPLHLTGGNGDFADSAHPSHLKQMITKGSPKTVETGAVMSKEESFPVGNHAYILKAVIVHVGNLISGHFVTYRRGPMNTKFEKKWFYTSDRLTKEVPFTKVEKAYAYMLFYEKLAHHRR